MPPEHIAALKAFISRSKFAERGAVLTDLDGTAVHEVQGRIRIAESVAVALTKLNRRGRPVVLNTLRFPRSVIQTFGREWYAITGAPLPLVTLNGSQTGYLSESKDGSVGFEEIDAVPLAADDIAELMQGLHGMAADGVKDLTLFRYPRDWTKGEILWTPEPDCVAPLTAKYASASQVVSSSLPELEAALLTEPHCMIFIHVNAPRDRRMAYQHSKPSQFITRNFIDKLAGAKRLAAALGFDLAHSIGAGDTPMDTFLKRVGLALHVGPLQLEHKGLFDTIRVDTAQKLGDLLGNLAALEPEIQA